MKKGDEIDARVSGTGRWTRCRIELASSNGLSLALSADEGLPLTALNRSGRQILLLSKEGEVYRSVLDGRLYELRAANV